MAIFQTARGWSTSSGACGLPKDSGAARCHAARCSMKALLIPSPCGLRRYRLPRQQAALRHVAPRTTACSKSPSPCRSSRNRRQNQKQNRNHWSPPVEACPLQQGLNRYSPRRNRFLRRLSGISTYAGSCCLRESDLLAGETASRKLDRPPHEAQASAPAELDLGYRNAVVVAPESSRLQLLLNNVGGLSIRHVRSTDDFFLPSIGRAGRSPAGRRATRCRYG